MRHAHRSYRASAKAAIGHRLSGIGQSSDRASAIGHRPKQRSGIGDRASAIVSQRVQGLKVQVQSS
jgi:hypothetical protein